MKPSRLVILSALLTAALPLTSARAEPLEPGYDPGKPLAMTPYYGTRTAESRASDLGFIAGMRPHHEGALTMSQEYLASSGARHPKLIALARGIILNQKFEIDMMNRAEKRIKADSGPLAWSGLSQQERFFRAPVPGPLDGIGGPKDASARDVQFAKAMIVHHQGALDMAREYLKDPNGENPYLRKLSGDILRDQAVEIAFMHDIIDTYPGNPDDVKIDSSMIHGMGHHSMGGHGKKAKDMSSHDMSHKDTGHDMGGHGAKHNGH